MSFDNLPPDALSKLHNIAHEFAPMNSNLDPEFPVKDCVMLIHVKCAHAVEIKVGDTMCNMITEMIKHYLACGS